MTIKMRHTDRVSKRRGLGGVPGARANELGKNIRVESGDASKGEARILEGQVDSITDLLLPHRAHGPSWSRTLM